jgi:hypothetical protein
MNHLEKPSTNMLPFLSQLESLNFKKCFKIELGIMRHSSLVLTRVQALSIEMEHSCCLRA